MAKTKEELNAITKEMHDLASKFQSLTDEELEEVTGGALSDKTLKTLTSDDLKFIGLDDRTAMALYMVLFAKAEVVRTDI